MLELQLLLLAFRTLLASCGICRQRKTSHALPCLTNKLFPLALLGVILDQLRLVVLSRCLALGTASEIGQARRNNEDTNTLRHAVASSWFDPASAGVVCCCVNL